MLFTYKIIKGVNIFMLKITNAFSTPNGIVIYSAKNPQIALYTYRDSCGNIISKKISQSEILEIGSLPISKNKLTIIMLLLCAISLLISLYFSHILCGIYFSCAISLHLTNFLIFLFSKSLKRVHATEHMIINCYNKGLRLSKRNIRKCSRLHKYCGFQTLFYKLICRSIVLVIFWIYNLKCGVISIIIFFALENFLKLFNYCPFFLLPQLLVTSKPSDYELELGLVAIKNYSFMEKE